MSTPATAAALSLADVEAAAARIAGAVVRTPMLYSKTLSSITGAQVWVQLEFPQVLERFVINAVAADMQRHYGKPEEADRLDDKALDALAQEARKAGIRPAQVIFTSPW